ncbi:hypothetical protein [Spirochaeta dissipatitropha]
MDRSIALGRSTLCANCGADLHVCLNCRHYDPAAAYQCRESVDREITDKDRGNFCDFFQLPLPGESVRGISPGKSNDKADDARKKLSSLFGD